jgi:fumarate reductase flavoprotein subunit
MKADLVVIGGGGAGLAAALAAAENGCKNVVVLEKTAAVGGNTARADGLFAIESPTQRAEGVEGTRDEMFRRATVWAQWKNDARVVRAYVDKSGDTIRWLGEKGLGFRLCPLYPGQSPLVWHLTSGIDMVRTLRRSCEQSGVRILTHARVNRILTSREGRVKGVVATSPDGERQIAAGTVVLASGGFGANHKLMKRFNPLYRDTVYYVGRAANVGDGVALAEQLGAAMDEQVAFLIEGPNTHVSARLTLAGDQAGRPKGMVGAMVQSLGMVAKVRYLVWLNRDGQRFIDESAAPIDMAYAAPILRQRDGLCFAAFDDQIRQLLDDQGLVGSAGPSVVPLRVPDLRRQMEGLQGQGVCKVAGSWEEIADWMGSDRPTLLAEIDQYNAACDQGRDPLLLKDAKYLMPLRKPPFYAIKCHTLLMDTLGGIKVNEKMQVLGEKVPVIPGLFAAGSCAGGLHGESYNYDLPGSGLGFAINSGRIAGESAARYVQTQMGTER